MKLGDIVLLISKDESHVIKINGDIHTQHGVIKFSELKKVKFGQKIKTHLGKEFMVLKATLLDLMERKFARGAQVILPKDIGLILGYTGIGSDSLIVDSGSGSGFLSLFLANFFPKGKVVTYEKEKRFHRITQDNIKLSGLKNIVSKNRDVSKGISEKNVDLITLDLQFPEKIIKRAYKALNIGGWLVVYSPTAEEVIKVSKELRKNRFAEIKTVEGIVREWQTERTTRPKTIGLMHTGWLTFARKLE